MARSFGVTPSSMWDTGSRFLDCSALAQHLYFYLTTRRDVGVSGLADYWPQRISTRAKGLTEDHVRRAAAELVKGKYIAVDEKTCEVLVLGAVAEDGVLTNPRLAAGVLNQLQKCSSSTLHQILVQSLKAQRQEHPQWAVWWLPDIGEKLAQLLGYNFSRPPVGVEPIKRSKANGNANRMASPMASGLTRNPGTQEPRKSSRSTAAPSISYDEGFARFWAIYPRRVGKPKAAAALTKALKVADLDTICAGAQRYRDDPNRADGFTAHPTTWLNREGWADDALPDRGREHLSVVPGGPQRDQFGYFRTPEITGFGDNLRVPPGVTVPGR